MLEIEIFEKISRPSSSNKKQKRMKKEKVGS